MFYTKTIFLLGLRGLCSVQALFAACRISLSTVGGGRRRRRLKKEEWDSIQLLTCLLLKPKPWKAWSQGEKKTNMGVGIPCTKHKSPMTVKAKAPQNKGRVSIPAGLQCLERSSFVDLLALAQALVDLDDGRVTCWSECRQLEHLRLACAALLLP